MPKLFSVMALVFSVATAFASTNDQELVSELSGGTIRVQFSSAEIPAWAPVLELGKKTLSDGDTLGCSLVFNAESSSRKLNGELLIGQASVSLEWAGRYYYHVWGEYSFNGSKKDFFELQCHESTGFISIGDFREYLQSINGSLTIP